MRVSRLAAVSAAATIAALTVTAGAAPAFAQPATSATAVAHAADVTPKLDTIRGRGDTRAQVSPSGVGYGVWSTINTATLFQCPVYKCNRGNIAWGLPSGHPDDVAAVCQIPGGGAWPNASDNWVLAYDHIDQNVGFIDSGLLVAQNGTFVPPSCDSAGVGEESSINTATLFQCPDTAHCNQGEITYGIPSGNPDAVAGFCYLPIRSPWGGDWALALDHHNDEVGFIDLQFLYPTSPVGITSQC